MAHNPSSKILFVTLGSLTKLPGGVSEYMERFSITSWAPEETGDLLLRTRAKALSWVKKTKEEWKGASISELDYNQSLVRGRDFGGNDERARYHPALHRFQGRFFQTLGEKGKGKLANSSRHHVLFICGLYGLMMPLEPIQLYSCPVERNLSVSKFWTEGGVLTNILIAYIREHEISRVFDLTAMSARRNLISWAKVRKEVDGNVFHCIGNMSPGDHLLVPFGYLMRDYMLDASEEELLSIEFGTKKSAVIQDVWFNKTPKPHTGKPNEDDPAFLNMADLLDRRQRAINQLLIILEGRIAHKTKETEWEKIDRLVREGRVDEEHAKRMHIIRKLRNPVHHENYQPTEEELAKADAAWQYLCTQAKKPENNKWRRVDEFRIDEAAGDL